MKTKITLFCSKQWRTNTTKLIIIKIIISLALITYPVSAKASAVSAESLIGFANQSRTQNHLPQLVVNNTLKRAASLKAQDILDKDYFAHTSPAGFDPWHWFGKVGYEFKYAGENLAIDFDNSSDIHNAWMASPSHRANILDKDFEEIGIAVFEGNFDGNQSLVVVQLFGTLTGSAKEKSKNEAAIASVTNQNSNATKEKQGQSQVIQVKDNNQEILKNNEVELSNLSQSTILKIMVFLLPFASVMYLI